MSSDIFERAGRATRSGVLARLPFTLLLEASILGVALALGLFDPEVGASFSARHGFGWTSLVEGRYLTLLTSTVLVDGPGQWLRIALLLTWSVGVLEWRAGTRWAVLVYSLTNLVSCLAAALLQGAVAALGGAELAFVQARDVGASAGAFGCLGAWIGSLAPPTGRRLAGLALVYVVLKPLLVPVPVSDLTHAVALALGLALSARRRRGSRPR